MDDPLADGLRYDSERRRKSVRRGRERGVWIFVPAAELRKCGIDPHDDPPEYKTWGRPSGGGFFRLYRD